MFDDCINIKELQIRKFELLHSRASEITEEEIVKINNEYMKARQRVTAGGATLKDVPVTYISMKTEGKRDIYGPMLIYGKVKSTEIRIMVDGTIHV